MKAAIYARYSSDNQRDASIADQLRICGEFAARQGWTVTQEFTDHAISGATLLRSGFQVLMRDAFDSSARDRTNRRSTQEADRDGDGGRRAFSREG
jgi:site-specific DNA recombinase